MKLKMYVIIQKCSKKKKQSIITPIYEITKNIYFVSNIIGINPNYAKKK